MNKTFKLSSIFILSLLTVLAFQSPLEARGCERRSRSSFSFNINFGLGGIGRHFCEDDYYAPAVYERRVIRESCPRVRERVIVYPGYRECYEEVIVGPPCYRERVIVYPYW